MFTFGWKSTRVLFAVGSMFIFLGAAGLIMDPTRATMGFAIVVGALLVALATRGPWDSESSGRNRSAPGFRARPE